METNARSLLQCSFKAALCVGLLALQTSAMAQRVTSILSVSVPPAPPLYRPTFKESGKLEDEYPGSLAGAKTLTEGISLVTLAGHLGRTFIHTAPFSTDSHALAGSSNPSASADAVLQRDARWRFDALKPQYGNAPGKIRVTFKWSWTVNFAFIAGYGYPGGCQVAVAFAGWNTFRDNNSSGSEFWTSPDIDITFDQPRGCGWTLRAVSSADRAESNGSCSGSAQVWKVEVFDQDGHLLNRYSDYEWYELPDGTNLAPSAFPVASGEMVPTDPDFQISLEQQTLLLNWNAGSSLNLFSSSTLQPGSWIPVTLPATLESGRWSVSHPMSGLRNFFQLRSAP